MKKFVLLSAIVGFAAGWLIVSQRSATELREKEAAWQKEKNALQAQLAAAHPDSSQTVREVIRSETVAVTKKQSPKEIIENLKTLRVAGRQTRNVRQAIQQFENLIELGPEALPEIQAFLAQQQDIEYDASIFGAWKGSKDGNVPIDFVFPPSLRFGLFDVVRQIGGEESEKLLSDALHVTGRGVEVAYLSRVLQQIAPFKYRELAITAAKDLLSSPANANSTSALDKFERNYLFGVLAMYNDASLAQQAQSQLVQGNGKIDQSALQYLQKTLGTNAIAAVAQIYNDSRLADGKEREPLGRLALTFAGADTQADSLWRTAINDKSIPTDARRELVEDLNQDGFDNLKNFSDRDLQLIRNRLALIEKYRSDADSKAIADAFNEAEKDLKEMLAKAMNRSVK